LRTLFTKILLWFLLTVVVTFWGTFYVSSIFQNRPQDNVRFRFELSEARNLWETQGATGLTPFFARLKRITGVAAVLTDGSGRDVMTGRDWSREIRSAAVVGAGTMGGGIAMNYANAGIPVLLKEVTQEALDRGLATIRRN